MYDGSLCFDPNVTIEIFFGDDGFYIPEIFFSMSKQFQSSLRRTTNNFNDNLKLQIMDEFSVFSSIVSLPNTETHNQSIINNNHLMQQMVHESNWSVYVNNSGFFLNTDQNSTTTPIPQLLNLLHLPSSNLPYIMADSCFTYDPLFHLNLPSQPPLIPANDYSGLLFRIDINANQVVDSNVGNENIIDCEIIEFSKNIGRKERGKQKNKPFTTERDRRCHLNERYEALKLLIPSPSKVSYLTYDNNIFLILVISVSLCNLYNLLFREIEHQFFKMQSITSISYKRE